MKQTVSPQGGMIAGKVGRPLCGLVAPTCGVGVPVMPVVVVSIVPDGKLEFGSWPGWKLTKVALAPTTLPTTLLGPLETVAFDTDVLIDPKLRAAIPPTKLFPPEPVTEAPLPTTPPEMVPRLMPTRPPMKLSEVPATWPGMGPESKLGNGLLTKPSETWVPGLDGELPGPEPGPPSDANADSEISPPLMPTNPPMMLFGPVLVTGPKATEWWSMLPANVSPASFVLRLSAPTRPPSTLLSPPVTAPNAPVKENRPLPEPAKPPASPDEPTVTGPKASEFWVRGL